MPSDTLQNHRLRPWVSSRLRSLIEATDHAGSTSDALRDVLMAEGKVAGESGDDLKSVSALVPASLEAMEAGGHAVLRNGQWQAPSALGLRRGRVERTGARFFRIRDLTAGPGSFYDIDARRLAGAGQGDVVLFAARDARTSARSRRDDTRSRDRGALGTARVDRVVEQRGSRWVGLLRDGDYGIQFQPFDHRLRFDARDLNLRSVLKDKAMLGADYGEGIYVSLEVEAGGTEAGGRSQDRGSKRGQRGGREHRGRGSREQQRGRDGGAGATRATGVRIIGSPSEPNIETAVVLAHAGISDHWPAAVRAEEKQWVDADNAELASGTSADGKASKSDRRDLRDLVTFTIDGATARDFDDALSIEPAENGVRLWVHIADVSHYVRPGSALDDEARARGTSVYFADRAIHMLPKGLSENLCSLRPDVIRRAMTVEMVFDPTGARSQTRAYPSLIRSDARLTYRQVEAHFEGEQPIKTKGVASALSRAQALARDLLKQRSERGAFEIEQDIGAFTIGKDGQPESYDSTPRLFAHRLIEEFMIQANVAVAELAAERLAKRSTGSVDATVKAKSPGKGKAKGKAKVTPNAKETQKGLDQPPTFLFRRHDPPKPQAMEELVEQVGALGVALPVEEIETVGDLAALLESVKDGPIRSFVEGLLLRSLKRAFYTPSTSEHFALGLGAYCHFTSPIRRYPDLVNHRFLKVVLFGDEVHSPTGGHHVGEEELAEAVSDLERRAEQAEREQFRWRMVRWLMHREGEALPVTVSAVQPFGMFVMLSGLGIDGLIPFEDVPGGEIEILTEGVEVVVHNTGQKSQRYRLGDSLDAVLVKADDDRRQLLLSLDAPVRAPKRRAADGARATPGRDGQEQASQERKNRGRAKSSRRRRTGR